MTSSIPSASVDAILETAKLIGCPVCGQKRDGERYETLLSCGHFMCAKCVHQFVRPLNKCQKCYAVVNNVDIKDDRFLVDLRKFLIQTEKLVTNGQKKSESGDETRKRNRNVLPAMESMTKSKPFAANLANESDVNESQIRVSRSDAKRKQNEDKSETEVMNGTNKRAKAINKESIKMKSQSIQVNVETAKQQMVSRGVQVMVTNKMANKEIQCAIINGEQSAHTSGKSCLTDFRSSEVKAKLKAVIDLNLCATLNVMLKALLNDNESNDCFVKPAQQISKNTAKISKTSPQLISSLQSSEDGSETSVRQSTARIRKSSVSRDNNVIKKLRSNSQDNKNKLKASVSWTAPAIRYSILYSGLSVSQKNKLENVAKELNANLYTEWCPEVTHLVVGLVDKKLMICVRNLKYFLSLMSKLYIVSFDWIIASEKLNQFIDEISYEIKGVRSAPLSNGPLKARTAKTKFFENYKVFIPSNPNKGLSKEDLQSIVIEGGGHVIKSDKELKTLKREITRKEMKVVVVCDDVSSFDTLDGITFVTVDQFLDAITYYDPI